MAILITGGAGMIGAHVVRSLVSSGRNDLIVIDNLSRGKSEHLDGIQGFDVTKSLLRLDLSNSEEVAASIVLLPPIDSIIHLADVVAGIGFVFGNENFIFNQNILINANTLKLALKLQPNSFIYVGTACSFPRHLQVGSQAVLSESQLFPAEPESSYGWSKLMGSLQMDYAFRGTSIKYSTLMLHNVYGPYTDYQPETSQVIPSLIRRAIELNSPDQPLTIWGDGTQSRTFLHASDAASAVVKLMYCFDTNTDVPPYIQIGTSHATTIKDLALLILSLCGSKSILTCDLSKPTGDHGRACDFSLARSVLGWYPQVSLHDGIEQLIAWIRDHL